MPSEPARPPLLGMSVSLCRVLHGVAFFWSLAAVAGLALAGPLDWLDSRPGGTAFEISERPYFMAIFTVGVLLALRWKIVGGVIAAFTASGLVVFAIQQLKPTSAIAVIAAFTVPAVLWIMIDLNSQRPRAAFVALVVALGAVAIGSALADNIYDRLFGPTHPASAAQRLAESPVEWLWSGAVTGDAFSVTAKLDDDAGEVRLAVSEDPDLAARKRHLPVARDDHGIVRFDVDRLVSDTTYHYAVEVDGTLDRIRAGSLRTFPVGPSSFRVAIGSDARTGSNGAVFDTIRATDPLLYVIPGDLHYADIGDPDRGAFEEVMDLTLTREGQAALYRSTPIAYVWDDHDFGGNGSDATTASAPVAQETFRRYVPHYPLAGPDSAVYQAFTVGRVRFIITDGRSARTPTSAPDGDAKSMLGADQKAWFLQELLDANDRYPLIVWVNALPWIGEATPQADDWGGYTSERREIADFIADNHIDGLLMLAGDAHMLAVDDGTNSNYSATATSGFPVFHSAALDRPGEIKGGPYSHGTIPGGGQFGVLDVVDDGTDTIVVSFSGRNWRGEELIHHELRVGVDDPAEPDEQS